MKCVRVTPPGIFADMQTDSQAAELDRRHLIRWSKVPAFVENVVIGQKPFLNCRDDLAVLEQTGGIGDTFVGNATKGRMPNDQTNIFWDRSRQ